MQESANSKIGIIGGGISGIAAAYVFSKKYDVMLLESHSQLGGHTQTIPVIDKDGQSLSIDAGFVLLNDCHYGVLHNLFNQWQVHVRWSDMSCSYYIKSSDYFYANKDVFSMFPKWSYLYSLKHLSLISEIARFGNIASTYLEKKEATPNTIETLEWFLNQYQFKDYFIQNYLLLQGTALWSMPFDQLLSSSAQTFLSLLEKFGLLGISKRPRWQTVCGGSATYVKKFKENFRGVVVENFEVVKVIRSDQGVSVLSKNGETQKFDEIVFACHADEILSVLENPTQQEVEIFSKWRYQKDIFILHNDSNMMPPHRVCWGSWNFQKDIAKSSAVVTYYMNKLQGIESCEDYFITVNDDYSVSDDKIIQKIYNKHPVFDKDTILAQSKLHDLQGKQRTYYCGSYFGEGFHEDAARSAVQLGLYKGLTI